MARVDTDRSAIPFPLSYCLICGASLPVLISSDNDRWVQEISCRVCRSMKGRIYLRPDSLLAEGWVALGDIKMVYEPAFLLHHPEIEVHQDRTMVKVWLAKAI